MSYDPTTNVNYDARDSDCVTKNPQPAFDTVTTTSDGWTPITYRNYNGDYDARDSNNNSRTPDAYSPRKSDNTLKIVKAYKRCPIETCNP